MYLTMPGNIRSQGRPSGYRGWYRGRVVLTVWNGGSEIPADERDRIFDRFYRGNKDRDRVEGAESGLAIARTIAEACKGKIWLEAEPLGTASRFELPLEARGMNVGRPNDREQHYITH